MVRIIVVTLLMLTVALCAIWVASHPGLIRLTWLGYETETSVAFAFVALVLLVGILTGLWRLGFWLAGMPERARVAAAAKEKDKSRAAFAQALIAFEAGDTQDLRKFSARIGEAIDDARLALMMRARSAEAAGDLQEAEKIYLDLLERKDGALLARRGLANLAAKRGDRAKALDHARAAIPLSRHAKWAFTMTFELLVERGEWLEALETLEDGEKLGHIKNPVLGRRRAVCYCAASAQAERGGDLEEALERVQKAQKLAPGFAPAAAMAARLLAMAGKPQKAAEMLEQAWEEAPHPALALAYRDLKPHESRQERALRMAVLTRKKPNHRESRIILVEQAGLSQDFDEAERLLGDLIEDGATSRLCGLMAELARARGDESNARAWMSLALSAPREADWSDLDPDGRSFNYTDKDWARMVFSYGDDGALAHPRQEHAGQALAGARPLALGPPRNGQNGQDAIIAKAAQDLTLSPQPPVDYAPVDGDEGDGVAGPMSPNRR